MGGLPWWSSVLDSVLPLQGARTGELRSHVLSCGQKKKKFFVCLLTLFIVIFGMLYIFVTVKYIHLFLRVSR